GSPYHLLNLDLRLGSTAQVQEDSLDHTAIASLLNDRLRAILAHLSSLQERMRDTSSKILVTGDLNAGKSTFCNALLRRNVLPIDQQPCTSVFAEILNAKYNDGVEEVHAVPCGSTYIRENCATYRVFPLAALHSLIEDAETYSVLKVYISKSDDHPTLIHNDLVGASLIDGPGLNKDSIQTTNLFTRQEEIDVVVFVVNAENYFTLSAQEFIATAAREKAFLFIVVNRFDNIVNTKKCVSNILEQVHELAPDTYDKASDLVHFVSSKNVAYRRNPGDDGDDSGSDDDENKENPEFASLESSLYQFVIQKRSLSKLAPSKKYSLSLLQDVRLVCMENKKYIEAKKTQTQEELDELRPKHEKLLKISAETSEQIDKQVESLSQSVYDYTRRQIMRTVEESQKTVSVPYPGFFHAIDYAISTREAIVQSIQGSVIRCENYAREQTITGFNAIKSIGLIHLQGNYREMVFRSEKMFTRRKDTLSRTLDTDLEPFDFIDLEKYKGLALSTFTSMSLSFTLFGIGPYYSNLLASAWRWISAIGGSGGIQRLFVPLVFCGSAATIVYVIRDIPIAVPRNVGRKIAQQLDEQDYIHSNALRLSRECIRLLQVPARGIRHTFDHLVNKQQEQKIELEKDVDSMDEALQQFKDIGDEADVQYGIVSAVDL
ncbi:hypothetical protein CANCADRAFT_20511, partial [Tortispora caseinolytica NRRL Y-17796]